jgi:hypothetical protein
VRKIRARLEVTSSNPRTRVRVYSRDLRLARVCGPSEDFQIFFDAGVPTP